MILLNKSPFNCALLKTISFRNFFLGVLSDYGGKNID